MPRTYGHKTLLNAYMYATEIGIEDSWTAQGVHDKAQEAREDQAELLARLPKTIRPTIEAIVASGGREPELREHLDSRNAYFLSEAAKEN